ncbi:MAG: hypothetical protein ACON5B_15125 [Myxococcota bacterium]
MGGIIVALLGLGAGLLLFAQRESDVEDLVDEDEDDGADLPIVYLATGLFGLVVFYLLIKGLLN